MAAGLLVFCGNLVGGEYSEVGQELLDALDAALCRADVAALAAKVAAFAREAIV